VADGARRIALERLVCNGGGVSSSAAAASNWLIGRLVDHCGDVKRASAFGAPDDVSARTSKIVAAYRTAQLVCMRFLTRGGVGVSRRSWLPPGGDAVVTLFAVTAAQPNA
jgi:hypothetical protein